ncbi:uncharacterized protein STEHIDRAFT_22851, partial [Stereum hirsutum FP-91666 SS1]|uniref:uncharacterized protein n=1 Tax=Stereum hirsutum (strain FP-91666) TaxID=721885 RepID=UPI000444A8C7
LRLSPTTNEPYLTLPAPYSHIIITPPRASDVEAHRAIIDDPRVYRWLAGPTIPYPVERARAFVARGQGVAREALAELTGEDSSSGREVEGLAGEGLRMVSRCPVNIIRERREDGTEVYLGDCSFARYRFLDEQDPDERKRMIDANEALPVGYPQIVWELADFLSPTHHGQGIMTAVMDTLMNEWCVPRMGMRHVRTAIFVGNEGSRRVMEKNGFALWKTV